MGTEGYEFATGIPTHDAASQVFRQFPWPNQIGERVRALQGIGFSENRAREVEHHYWPMTHGERVTRIAPPQQARFQAQRTEPPTLSVRLLRLLRPFF